MVSSSRVGVLHRWFLPYFLLQRQMPMGVMRGDDVKALQSMLNVLGFDCGVVDGIFGDKTRAGVKAFQQAKGLVTDGIVGPLTRAALLAAE